MIFFLSSYRCVRIVAHSRLSRWTYEREDDVCYLDRETSVAIPRTTCWKAKAVKRWHKLQLMQVMYRDVSEREDAKRKDYG